MQAIAEISLERPQSKMEYLIDRDELLHLRAEKIIPTGFYVYLAIKITYSESHPSIDIEHFCDAWDVSETELASAIAQLHKKGALRPRARQLELELLLD